MNADTKLLISCANQLIAKGYCDGSVSEHIGGAFVLNNMALLPVGHVDVVDAWRQLGRAWQRRVMTVKAKHMDLIAKAQPIDRLEHFNHPYRFMIAGHYLVRYPTELGDTNEQ